MIIDCDLVIGRDIGTGITRSPQAVRRRLDETGISGGVVTSLRALSHDAASGNGEAQAVADAQGWFMACGVDLRDPLGAQEAMEHAAQQGTTFVRFAPGRQGVDATAPRLRILASVAAALGMIILVEGSTRHLGTALMGLGAAVVLLDQHFHDAGEFVLVAREETGFHTSTRLLGSPDAWEVIASEVGAERLVFGARSGWFEEHAVLERLRSSGLDARERELVTSGNLLRLMGAEA